MFQLPSPGDTRDRADLYGIPEWYCWFHNLTDFNVPIDRVIKDCIDDHLALGIDRLVWNCGRSRVDYDSDLPDVTAHGDGVDPAENSWPGFRARVSAEGCPLRRALTYCRERGAFLLGRLGMNRHYGVDSHPDLTSRLAAEHPEYHERTRDGRPVTHKLCYAVDEVRRERLDILLEVQRIGVDALVLDFCRQVPILMYHPALVEPFMAQRGYDPREIQSDRFADFREWFLFRADVLTAFMRDLRAGVRRQERQLERPCPVVARIPDNADWITLAFGLDLETWFAEDLIDATMLSPFPLVEEDLGRHPEDHVRLAHEHGKPCIGGVGSLRLIVGDGPEPNAKPEDFFHSKPVYALAHRQYAAGVDGMSLYQSETLARLPYLQPLLRELADKPLVARRAEQLAARDILEDALIGLDWHTKHNAFPGLRGAPHCLGGAGQKGL